MWEASEQTGRLFEARNSRWLAEAIGHCSVWCNIPPLGLQRASLTEGWVKCSGRSHFWKNRGGIGITEMHTFCCCYCILSAYLGLSVLKYLTASVAWTMYPVNWCLWVNLTVIKDVHIDLKVVTVLDTINLHKRFAWCSSVSSVPVLFHSILIFTSQLPAVPVSVPVCAHLPTVFFSLGC